MRRGASFCIGSSPHTAAASAISLHQVLQNSNSNQYARRGFKQHLSPDRTRNEEIVDRQSRFHWDERHTFRPHQRFTFDPTDWNRQLEMAARKKQGALSITERLRNLEEHEQERTMNMESIRQAATDEKKGTTVSSASSSSSPRSGDVQRSLDSVMESHRRLTSSRFASNRQEIQTEIAKQSYARVLLRLYHLVRRDAALRDRKDKGKREEDKKVSRLPRDSVMYLWVQLLRGAEFLIEARQKQWSVPNTKRKGAATPDMIVKEIYSVMNLSLSSSPTGVCSDGNNSESDATQGLEAAIESLFVATHPLVIRHHLVVDGNASAASPSWARGEESSPETLLLTCIQLLQSRAQSLSVVEESGVEVFRSVIEPSHLVLLWRSVLRVAGNTVNEDKNALLLRVYETLIHRTHYEVHGLLRVAKAQLRDTQGARRTIHSKLARGGEVLAAEVVAPYRRRTVGSSVRCTGIVSQPEVTDVELNDVLRCCIMSLEILERLMTVTPSAEVAQGRLQKAMLELLEHSANYDLAADDVSEWLAHLSVTIPSGDLVTKREDADGILHMCFLLASRLRLLSATTSGLKQLLFALLELPLPAPEQHVEEEEERGVVDDEENRSGSDDNVKPNNTQGDGSKLGHECKRLRGLVLHDLLNVQLPASTLVEAFTEAGHDLCLRRLCLLVATRPPLRLRTWSHLIDAVKTLPTPTLVVDERICALLIVLRVFCRAPQQQTSRRHQGGDEDVEGVPVGDLTDDDANKIVWLASRLGPAADDVVSFVMTCFEAAGVPLEEYEEVLHRHADVNELVKSALTYNDVKTV